MLNRKTLRITLCVVTALFLKFFFRAQSFIFINPLQWQCFSVFDSIWKYRKEPGKGGGGEGGTPPPPGEKKNFSIFSFPLGNPGIISCWLHASLPATSCITYILPFQKIRKREMSNHKMIHQILITYMYYFSLFCPRL